MFRKKQQPVATPDWLFVGLGNPGGEYDGTRHNVGFEAIRLICERNSIKLTTRKFQSHFGIGRIGVTTVVLAKPMTYMNSSGGACAQLLRHFNLPHERLVIVYDDMDHALGRVQLKPKGGSGSHNGMKSIVSSIGTKEFPRVRIGIGSPAVSGVDFVLSRFELEEIDVAREAIERAALACEFIANEGVDFAMNRINLPEAKTESESPED